jgi:hypothetical protein
MSGFRHLSAQDQFARRALCAVRIGQPNIRQQQVRSLVLLIPDVILIPGAQLFLLNEAIKPDYSPVRDAVSEAETGRGGWVQIANFIISGLLIASSSVAIAQTVLAVRAMGAPASPEGSKLPDFLVSSWQRTLWSFRVFGRSAARRPEPPGS